MYVHTYYIKKIIMVFFSFSFLPVDWLARGGHRINDK